MNAPFPAAVALTTQAFTFEGTCVETATIDDEVWFLASDVCKALGLTNVSAAVSRLDPDERRDSRVCTDPQAGFTRQRPRPLTREASLDTRLLIMVGEYLAIERALDPLCIPMQDQDSDRTPEARTFRAFQDETKPRVDELLDAIRRTPAVTANGRYAKAEVIQRLWGDIEQEGKTPADFVAFSLAQDVIDAWD